MTVLSKRLSMVHDLVPEGRNVADIGTDHALLAVRLLEEGKATHCIAADVKKGPLQSAEKTVTESPKSVQEKIVLRLSDGFAEIAEGEADCAVMAGMGGDLICRLLAKGDVRDKGITTLVLQPQSEWKKVRSFLRDAGWMLTEEAMVLEAPSFYTAMRFEGQESQMDAYAGLPLEPALRFGPVLLRKKEPVLREYLRQEEKRVTEALLQVKAAAQDGADRITELEEDLNEITTALRMTEGIHEL